MPRGSQPGERRGGRKAGTPNKKTEELEAILRRLNCSPEERLALIANGTLPCCVCFGKGRTHYLGKNGKMEMRKCESCRGTLREKISPSLIKEAAAELLSYLRPKRKAIEHTGPEGGAIEHSIKVVYVDPKVN